MSPESQKYVTPMPPAGTKRRPAKKPESVIELDDDFHKYVHTRALPKVRVI